MTSRNHHFPKSPTEVEQAGESFPARWSTLLRWRNNRRRHAPPNQATRLGRARPTPSPRLSMEVFRKREPWHASGRGQRTHSTCHTRTRVCGRGKLFDGDQGARGSELPLMRSSRGHGHRPRTHLSQSRGMSTPAPTAFMRDFPHVEAVGNPTLGGERRTGHRRPEPAD